MACNLVYTLPAIEFVGGETQELYFNVLSAPSKAPVDMTESECSLSVSSYADRSGAPLFSVAMDLAEGDDGVSNMLHATISANDTVDLCGKYLYQVSIYDGYGAYEQMQGVMTVYANIDKGFIKQRIPTP